MCSGLRVGGLGFGSSEFCVEGVVFLLKVRQFCLLTEGGEA